MCPSVTYLPSVVHVKAMRSVSVITDANSIKKLKAHGKVPNLLQCGYKRKSDPTLNGIIDRMADKEQ